MKETSEPAVQPRRNILGALWVWAIGLLAAPKLLAAPGACQAPPIPPPDPCEDTLKKYEYALLIGRLCLDETFREDFFSKSLDDAKTLLRNNKMLTRTDMDDKVEKIKKAHKSPENPVQDACYSVQSALTMARVPSLPCNPWPC